MFVIMNIVILAERVVQLYNNLIQSISFTPLRNNLIILIIMNVAFN